jgi:CRP/FNR family cyclic AMP-dependent transcriptional regulator
MEGTLSPFSFLNKLTCLEQQSLRKIAHLSLINKNSYIFRADDINDVHFVLLAGRVKILRLSHRGREYIQWFCLPGEIFGLSEDGCNLQRGLYAQAVSELRLLSIQKQDFEKFLFNNPRIALLVIKQVTTRLRTLGDMLLSMSSEDVHDRFSKLLQRLCESYGRNTQEGIHIELNLTHQEMADMIGVCRQTVTSMISSLKQRGIINSNRSGIYVQQPQELGFSKQVPDNRLKH